MSGWAIKVNGKGWVDQHYRASAYRKDAHLFHYKKDAKAVVDAYAPSWGMELKAIEIMFIHK